MRTPRDSANRRQKTEQKTEQGTAQGVADGCVVQVRVVAAGVQQPRMDATNHATSSVQPSSQLEQSPVSPETPPPSQQQQHAAAPQNEAANADPSVAAAIRRRHSNPQVQSALQQAAELCGSVRRALCEGLGVDGKPPIDVLSSNPVFTKLMDALIELAFSKQVFVLYSAVGHVCVSLLTTLVCVDKSRQRRLPGKRLLYGNSGAWQSGSCRTSVQHHQSHATCARNGWDSCAPDLSHWIRRTSAENQACAKARAENVAQRRRCGPKT